MMNQTCGIQTGLLCSHVTVTFQKAWCPNDLHHRAQRERTLTKSYCPNLIMLKDTMMGHVYRLQSLHHFSSNETNSACIWDHALGRKLSAIMC